MRLQPVLCRSCITPCCLLLRPSRCQHRPVRSLGLRHMHMQLRRLLHLLLPPAVAASTLYSLDSMIISPSRRTGFCGAAPTSFMYCTKRLMISGSVS